MSAAEKISQTGAGLKNIAIAVGIAGALYVAYLLYQELKKLTKTGSEAAGYLFGGDNAPRTLGTDIYDATHGPVDYYDPAQPLKTCLALYPAGSGKTPKPGGECEQIFKANGLL